MPIDTEKKKNLRASEVLLKELRSNIKDFNSHDKKFSSLISNILTPRKR